MKNTRNPIEIMSAFLSDIKLIEKQILKANRIQKRRLNSKLSDMRVNNDCFIFYVDFDVDLYLRTFPGIKGSVEYTDKGIKLIY